MDKFLVLSLVTVCCVIGAVTSVNMGEAEDTSHWSGLRPYTLLKELLTNETQTSEFQQLSLKDQDYLDAVISNPAKYVYDQGRVTTESRQELIDGIAELLPSIDKAKLTQLVNETYRMFYTIATII